MKKVIYFLILMSAMTLISVGCSKDSLTPDPALTSTVKTLAQQYPDWVNLSWVSTTQNGAPVLYPRMAIKIVGNEITLTATDLILSVNQPFNKITLTNTNIKFENTRENPVYVIEYTYSKGYGTIILTPTPYNPNKLVYTLLNI